MSTSEFHYQYKLYQGQYSMEDQAHLGYGISILDTFSQKEILCIENISSSKDRMITFIKQCNDHALSPIHIYDVIEDLFL